MSPHPSRLYSAWFRINFCSALLELFNFLPQSMFYRGALIDRVLFRVAPHIFGDVDELRQPANLALLVTLMSSTRPLPLTAVFMQTRIKLFDKRRQP